MSKYLKNLLSDIGFEFVALPKANIKPLLLLIKEKDHLSSLNSQLSRLFEEDIKPIPLVKTDASNFSGSKALELKLDSGIDILGNLFKAFGLTQTALKAKLEKDKNLDLSFSFEDVEEEVVSYLDLDNFLNGSIPREDEFKHTVEQLKNGDLYVITATLKSPTFTVSLTSSKGIDAVLKTEVEKLVGANANLNHKGGTSFSVTSINNQAFVFAFKAVQILYDKAKWFEFWNKKEAGFRIKNQEGFVLRGPEDFPVQLLKTETGISNI